LFPDKFVDHVRIRIEDRCCLCANVLSPYVPFQVVD
jgi:hypothetical protein